MIKALLRDDAFLSDLDDVLPDPRRLSIWWLGQSGYLIYWNGKRLLLDPYLSDSLSVKYKDTDKPHIRMSERVIAPEKLLNIDFLSSSHSHTDHLDPETISRIIKNNPGLRFIIPEATRGLASQRGQCDFDFPIGLNAGESYAEGQVRFKAIPSAHESLDKDEAGNHLYLGYIIHLGPWTLYHSGDTVLYPELAGYLKPYAPQVVFLPINETDARRKVAGNMNAKDAVWLSAAIGARITIPGHYHLFEFNTVEPDEFIDLARKQGIGHAVLRHGERLNLEL